MPATFQISSRALTLRPVTARVVSYGRSAKMAQRATLYVLRVARAGREWYVARRYSEFRALYTALRHALATPHAGRVRLCAQCRELARRFADLAFPSRFPVRSGFASAREKIESARMQQLDAFVQVLMETTQGLLANQDDDDDDDEDDDDDGCSDCTDDNDGREDRCDALRIVREFLLVHDHVGVDPKKDTTESASPETLPSVSDDQQPTPEGTPRRRRPRLASSSSFGSTTTTFRVQELDVMYRPTSPMSAWICMGSSNAIDAVAAAAMAHAKSPNVLDDHELDELFLADYASPAEDAVIHRQLEYDADGFGTNGPAVHVLRRAESLRMSRRV